MDPSQGQPAEAEEQDYEIMRMNAPAYEPLLPGLPPPPAQGIKLYYAFVEKGALGLDGNFKRENLYQSGNGTERIDNFDFTICVTHYVLDSSNGAASSKYEWPVPMDLVKEHVRNDFRAILQIEDGSSVGTHSQPATTAGDGSEPPPSSESSVWP